MLQDNLLTGLLFLTGIFYNSWLMGIGAIIGIIVSNLAAVFLKYDYDKTIGGFYGSNGTLVGIAAFFFFSPIVALPAAILASILSTIVMKGLYKLKIPPYTAPFVASTWVLFVFLSLLQIPLVQHAAAATPLSFSTALDSVSLGFGQVMFQNNIITGLFFLAGLLVSSRIVAGYALLGSALGATFAYLISFPPDMVTAGLFGFNAVLCGAAFASKKTINLFAAIAAIIASVLVMQAMTTAGIPALTAPFVLATWLILLMLKKFQINQ